MKIKFLILDFDGVVISPDEVKQNDRTDKEMFKPKAVEQLNNLLYLIDYHKEFDIKIVISASMRNRGIDKITEILKYNNITLNHTIDATGSPKKTRGQEIKDYIDKHQIAADDFVIIDDSWLSCAQYFPYSIVGTKYIKGYGFIEDWMVDKAYKILSTPIVERKNHPEMFGLKKEFTFDKDWMKQLVKQSLLSREDFYSLDKFGVLNKFVK